MSKAVLVLERMPKSCDECHCCNSKCGVCGPANKEVSVEETVEKRPEWCPLKAFPEKMDICGTYDAEYRAKGGWMPSMKIGWNKCVEYLLGEENDKQRTNR